MIDLDLKWKIKSFIYRKKLFKKLKKHYVAPWDMVEAIDNFYFELLVLFIDDGGIDIVNWNSDKWHKAAMKEMQEIYGWYKKTLPKSYEDLSLMTEKYFKKYPMIWDEEKDEKDRKMMRLRKSPEESNKEFKKITEKEKAIEDKINEMLLRVIKIKNFMWT